MSLDRAIPPNPYSFLPPVPEFTLTSDDVADGEQIGVEFLFPDTVAGAGNLSPQLSWSGFPAETASFAVTCFDPDAPVPSGFWHWAMGNLAADVTSLPRGAGAADVDLGSAVVLRSDWGSYGYGGPQPPQGDRVHRYYFVVHAVDIPSLEIDNAVSPAVLSFNLAFHTLARATIVPTYLRP